MNFVVKNTTKVGLLDLVCPHTCRGCGQLGDVLCECCKKNLIHERQAICPLCKSVLAGNNKNDKAVRCLDCELPFEAVFVGGWKEGLLGDMVKEYKYQAVRKMGDCLAEVLDVAIGDIAVEEEITLIPLPTIGKHIRARGFDHTQDLVKKLAKRRGWRWEKGLVRRNSSVQVGADTKSRQKQAREAYMMAKEVDANGVYMLVDDIWTTGASMMAAAEVLRKAGGKRIMAAVVATGRAKDPDEK